VELFGSAWAQLGAVGLLALVVLAIVTGRLVPRSVASTLVKQANATATQWQAAAEASDQRADEAVKLLGEVLSALRSVETLVRTGHRDAA
jgi:ABC-type nickel/cobalt efflux system permease component RcnA